MEAIITNKLLVDTVVDKKKLVLWKINVSRTNYFKDS